MPSQPGHDPLAGDDVLGPLVEEHGRLDVEVAADPFARLVMAIVNQQLSTASARAIRERFTDRFAITPAALRRADVEDLAAVGLSRRKIEYIVGIAEEFERDDLTPATFETMSDDEVVRRLVAIRGVGTWTAKIFLMFALGRPDVFPVEDLGIRRGMTRLLGDMDETAMAKEAERWAPHRSRASLYVWRAADMKRGR